VHCHKAGVISVNVLLAVFGSGSFPATLAVLVSVPPAVGVTTIVTVALPLFAMLPSAHVTVPAA
jgi:hypothetical protein